MPIRVQRYEPVGDGEVVFVLSSPFDFPLLMTEARLRELRRDITSVLRDGSAAEQAAADAA